MPLELSPTRWRNHTMAKGRPDALRIKRKYLQRLREAKGLSEQSVDKAAAAIDRYLAWLAGGDLRNFHSEKAIAFKRHLAKPSAPGAAAPAISTVNSTLRELRAFFLWLAEEPGFRSRLSMSDADWFSPDRKSERARRGELYRPHPSVEQTAHAIRSMPTATIFERRDQALMCFLFLTGARERSAMTVRMQHIDLPARCVRFDGKLVDTKFGKRFTTKFFPVGQEFEDILASWMTELKASELWGPTDPCFPKTAVGVGVTGGFEPVGLERAPWTSPARVVQVFKGCFEAVGLPPFSPHSIRRTLMDLASVHCRTVEELKSWSQNLGHEDLTTTLTYYGSVSVGRQMEVIERMARRLPTGDRFLPDD